MKFIISLSLFIVLSLSSCKKDNPVVPLPPEPPKAVTLSLADVSCTEAFIKVTAADSVLPLSISLMKDDIAFANLTLTKTDTVVIDTTLQPDYIYTYQTRETINGKEEKSDTIQVKSLNVSSNNFTWTTFYVGDFSGVFYDCAVISDDDIWCTGEFGVIDTLHNTDSSYNAIHWNGIAWEPRNILYNGLFWTIKSIYAFSSNDILFSAFVKYDGNNFTSIPIPNILMGWEIKKVWGISSNDYYVVGNGGNIAHYQGGVWHKLTSGTNLNLNDIYGYTDDTTGEQTILAAGGNILESTERIILQIKDNQVQEISTAGTIEYPLGGVWLHNNYKYYVAGPGFYSKYYNQNNWQQSPTPYYYIYSMRGNKLDDIIITGGKGYVGHFNGVNWTNYIGNGLEETSGNYYSASIKGNTAAVAGDLGDGRAIVVIGNR